MASTYARFDPYDPEAVRFVKWLTEVGRVQVTDFDATIERDVMEVDDAFDGYRRFVPSPTAEVTVHLTLRGSLPPGATFRYSDEAVQEDIALPPSTKALP